MILQYKKKIMKNIIYFNKSDVVQFHFDRFRKSLNKYANIPSDEIRVSLADFDIF